MNALDRALEQLHDYGCDLKNGLTNHAPMVAEAMHHLGLDDSIEPWVSAELPRIELRPIPSGASIRPDWTAALGGHFADWCDFFSGEIRSLGWHATLTDWIPKLAPGFSAAAAHGVIRVGHAVRGLNDLQSAPRERELADALASWASTYATLPTSDITPEQLSDPAQALAAIPLVSAQHHYPDGSITGGLTALDAYPQFAIAVNSLDRDRPLNLRLPELANVFAHLFLQSVDTPLRAIVFTHAITGLAAVRNLSSELTHVGSQDLLYFAWQTVCGLHAVYSKASFQAADMDLEDRARPAPDALITAAIEHGDEHVIKLTEACVTLHRAYELPAMLGVATLARTILPPRTRRALAIS
jgi:hypothetical protein